MISESFEGIKDGVELFREGSVVLLFGLFQIIQPSSARDTDRWGVWLGRHIC